MTETELIQNKISELSAALLAAHPTMPSLLRDIHTQLKKDPALVTILSPEEMNIIVQGLEKQTNNYLADSVTKPKAAAKAALKNLTADDFGF